MSVVAVFNQKGGVGKTTTSLNVSASLLQQNKTVVAIDIDPQANLTTSLGIKNVSATESIFAFFTNAKQLQALVKPTNSQIHIIPGHLEIAKLDTLLGKSFGAITRLMLAFKTFGPRYSHSVIDCSPVLTVPTLNALFASDYVLIPVSADHLSVLGAQQVEKTLDVLGPVMKRSIPRRYVITRFNASNEICWDVDRKMRHLFKDLVCRTRIRESAALGESPISGMDVFSYAPMSNGAGDYEALYFELQQAGWF